MANIEAQAAGVALEPLDALGPFRESDLCKPAAVRLTYMQLKESKEANQALRAELSAERAQIGALITRAGNAEGELRVLRRTLGLNDRRDRVVRLIEFAMILVISFLIDAARSSEWTLAVGLGIASVALGGAVALIQWWPAEAEKL